MYIFLAVTFPPTPTVIYNIISEDLLNVLKKEKTKNKTAAALQDEGILCEKEQIYYIHI